MNRVAATWRNGCTFGTQGSRRNQRAGRDDGGFTLIELIVVVAIMPIIVGALSLGLVSILSLQSGVSGRLADSGDAQVVSVNFGNDVQSAANITTMTAAQCGSGKQLLGLEWNPSLQPGNFQTVVSYVVVANANGLTSSLIRQYCTGGSSTPTNSVTVSSDVPNNQPAPTIAPPSSNTAAMSGWTPTAEPVQIQRSGRPGRERQLKSSLDYHASNHNVWLRDTRYGHVRIIPLLR